MHRRSQETLPLPSLIRGRNMDDPDHTRNSVILEEGVLFTRCSVWVMGILKARSDYHNPSMPSHCLKKNKNNRNRVKAAVRWQLQQHSAQGSHRSVLFVAFLKVNLQLPSTWLQSCLPLSKSQLHRCSAVPVKAVTFHTQTHVGLHLHRCAVHTHSHRQTPAAATLLSCSRRHG